MLPIIKLFVLDDLRYLNKIGYFCDFYHYSTCNWCSQLKTFSNRHQLNSARIFCAINPMKDTNHLNILCCTLRWSTITDEFNLKIPLSLGSHQYSPYNYFCLVIHSYDSLSLVASHYHSVPLTKARYEQSPVRSNAICRLITDVTMTMNGYVIQEKCQL